MIKLQYGSKVGAELDQVGEKNIYFFILEPNSVVEIAFTAPSFEYEVTYSKIAHPIEKGDTVDAHDGSPIDFTSTETFTFSEEAMHTVYLTVASANEGALPSDGYTISMNVDEG